MTVPVPIFVIQATSAWRGFAIDEIWRYRELLYFLVWRDLKVRFKQTVLGVAWILLRPILSMIVFTVIFARLAKMPSDGLPYPLFVFAAMLPWNFFSGAVTAATVSLVGNAHLVSKVYFPRIIIPIAAMVSGLVDIAISFGLVLALMCYYDRLPPWSTVVTMPLLCSLNGMVSLGVGVWLGALNVKYRDVGSVIPFVLQLWMYATPVVYPLSMVPGKYRWLVALNPLTGVVEGFRAALFGSPWPLGPLALSAVLGISVLASGLLYFRSSERILADTV